MKSNEKRMITILVAITAVVIIIAIMMNVNKSKEGTTEKEMKQTESTISLFDDGTTLNNSAKLQETKKLEGMEISQIQVTQ